MAFQVSPGVNVSEIDLTTVVPAVSTTEGALAGVFRWGPVNTRILVDSEASLASRFGKPSNFNAETWFTGANFLSYGNKLYVVRTANTSDATGANGVLTAIANTSSVADLSSYVITNEDVYYSLDEVGQFATDSQIKFAAKYPGALGNSLKISVCDSVSAYNSTANLVTSSAIDSNTAKTSFSISVGSNTAAIAIANSSTGTSANTSAVASALTGTLVVGDYLEIGNTSIGKQYMKITSVSNAVVNSTSGLTTLTIGFDDIYTLSSNYSSQSVSRYWEYFNSVSRAPGVSDYQSNFGNSAAVDEVHTVVVDENGSFTGIPGTILEVFQGMSRASDAKTIDGATNYYKNIINQQSNYVWFMNPRAASESNTAINLVNSAFSIPSSLSFVSGADGDGEANVPMAILAKGYDQFASAEQVDVSLVLQGKARGGSVGEQLANYIIDNVAEARKDCVAFVSPRRETVVNHVGSEASDIIAFRNAIHNSSYAFMDTGYKYQYDKYNDLYRYIPLNGDVAGLAVRTDSQRDPWFSPAGFNRGQIKNIIKLAFNPSKAERDILYKADVNPVVTFPGQGTVLFGDKTLLGKPSAFDRINVRRLFIVLEKAIATASKFTLFEFNDGFTRAQFKNLVEPFLRDVQGRRGIYEFKVVCDETNNTGEVIDSNRFVGDIYIKPARSINFIQLNFVAVRTGVQFSEVVGKF
jgi:hypothetical protein